MQPEPIEGFDWADIRTYLRVGYALMLHRELLARAESFSCAIEDLSDEQTMRATATASADFRKLVHETAARMGLKPSEFVSALRKR
jgi:hypothetical protein